jgi:hypothetical protein
MLLKAAAQQRFAVYKPTRLIFCLKQVSSPTGLQTQ